VTKNKKNTNMEHSHSESNANPQEILIPSQKYALEVQPCFGKREDNEFKTERRKIYELQNLKKFLVEVDLHTLTRSYYESDLLISTVGG
jgi:hypothetical protein